MNHIQRLLLLLLVVCCTADALSQSSRRSSRYRNRLYTPYFNQNAAYGYNPYGYNAGGYNPYAYTNPILARRPVATPQPTLPPVTGPVERYSPVEYGDIVTMALEAARNSNPLGDSPTTRTSIVEMTSGTAGMDAPTYKPVLTTVADILDRGIILLPNGEEVRLRGLTIPSSTDTNGVNRLYGKEAVQLLHDLTRGKQIAILLDDPLRDSTGRLLGTILLTDGTELNRRMLESGYGTVKEDDFGDVVDFSDMTAAQTTARDKRLGIWSSNF